MVGGGSLEQRVPLAHEPTPLEPMDRLAAALGLPAGTLWVKRDDCTGLAGGGNKARKLDYLCAEATRSGCDVLVTGGGPQSNHVRMTAAAAGRLGLGCVAVLAGDPVPVPDGNLVLDRLLGAELVWAGPVAYYELERAIEKRAEEVAAGGRRPYAVPVGGASVTGTLGYVRAALELSAQQPDVDLVVTADGSGGTHAGLVAGLADHGRVLGIDVGVRPDLDSRVPEMADAAAAAAGVAAPGGTCQVDHGHFGPGYGAPTPETLKALELAARTEGLILDPVYTGKAMAGLMAAVGEGRVRPGQRVVFMHTGGMPALLVPRYGRWVGGGA